MTVVKGEPAVTGNLLYLTKRLEQAIRSFLDEELRPLDVTTLHYTALAELALRDGISGARLARESFVTPQSMAEMLRLLQDRGYISRTVNPESRREYLVFITEEGRALVDRLEPMVRDLESRMVAGLSASSVETFRGLLRSAGTSLRQKR